MPPGTETGCGLPLAEGDNTMRGKLLILAVLGLALTALMGGCYSRSARSKAKADVVAQGTFETAPMADEGWVEIVPEGVEYAEPAAVIESTPSAVSAKKPTVAAYSRGGFHVYEEDGRYWVFEAGSEAEAGYLKVGEPAKSVTKIGVGPEGRTVRSDDATVIAKWLETIGVSAPKTMPQMAFKFVRPGFAVYEEDGRLWIFEDGSQAHQMFLKVGEPAKSVTKVGEGPEGRTVRSDDTAVVASYMAAWKYGRPGFAVFLDDGRLWILREGSEDLATFLRVGEPAKSVTRIGVGPAGETIRSSDVETIDAWTTSWMKR